ncbi:hypothetical protein AAFF_G00088920 [Aldrovandia affinis]|uniref:Reverse transcriptase domain-containing protein n=1 Tax=Aldrovandia affinis TaxID=143900 RepID=A0AAD7R1B3_9TELE|nr:hypothetical protein AAFF_G00088920 [Aldrovandia affinis]
MKCVLLPSWALDHDMLRVSLPADGPKWGPGFWRLNTSLLGSGAFVKAFTRCYSAVRALRPLYSSVVEWWEAAKSRFASFCRLHAVGARRRDGAEVAKWSASLAYLHGRLNRGEQVDWAAYEGAKERLRGLLEARAKALVFQARLLELEEGERPTAYFFQAAKARRGASAIAGLRRVDGTLAERLAMLAVAESRRPDLQPRFCFLSLRRLRRLLDPITIHGDPGALAISPGIFSRRVCDPAAEARLLACVSARLGAEEAQAMEADMTLEEVREALMALRDARFPVRRLGPNGGARFIGWVRTLYAGAYSCVRVNGFLSGAVEQAGGVRQGCPLSPLLYVLFMEPFAELVRRDPGVDGVRLPGAAGEVLKIQQYADDTTLFVSSVRSLGRIRTLTDLFGAGTGSRVNMAKSSVLFCGSWTEDIGDSGGSVLLPLLLHLAYVFPVLARAKLALTRAVFHFLWGGRYEYVSRELMYAPVAGGGVSEVPLKLGVLYASFASKMFLERVPHRCFFLARFYLAGFFRHLEALTHVVPRADVRSPAYEAVARFFRQCPPSISRAEALDHRALYARLACRQVVVPSGVPAGVRWDRVSGGGAPGMVRDLHWQCALGVCGARGPAPTWLLCERSVSPGVWGTGNGASRLLGMPLRRGVLGFSARPS